MKDIKLPFTSSVSSEKQAKELSLTPSHVVQRQRLGRMGATWRRRKKRKREQYRQWILKTGYKQWLEGKYYYLRKVYNQRARYQRDGLPPRYQEGGSEAGVIPRWWESNNVFLLSFEEFKMCWDELNAITGLSHKDRGLGRKETKKFWSRNIYGDLKFGRRDRERPFERGNIEIYAPVKNSEIDEYVKYGYDTPKGRWRVEALGRSPAGYRAKRKGMAGGVRDMDSQSDTGASGGILAMEEAVPLRGDTLVIQEGRLIIYRC